MARRVLLVEDDASTRKAMTRVLVRFELDVTAMATAEEALDLLPGETFETAILDIRLPGMWGHELARLVKARQPGCRIIFFSAEHEGPDLKEFGPDSLFFQKPLDITRLSREFTQ